MTTGAVVKVGVATMGVAKMGVAMTAATAGVVKVAAAVGTAMGECAAGTATSASAAGAAVVVTTGGATMGWTSAGLTTGVRTPRAVEVETASLMQIGAAVAAGVNRGDAAVVVGASEGMQSGASDASLLSESAVSCPWVSDREIMSKFSTDV